VNVAIVDYGSGNLRSAAKAVERAALETGHRVVVTSDPDAIRAADRIVLPGVGAFADCRRGLDAVSGMVETLNREVIERGKPFLGICVGAQLMADRGVEKETTQGLGWIGGDVVEITPADPSLKVPHMGWNNLEALQEHPLLAGIPLGEDGLEAYFVHSYHLQARNEDDVIARADYGGPVTAIVGRDNFAGTQFHPEKSQQLGLALLANFLNWRP
jgi:glutamine amidotransferase